MTKVRAKAIIMKPDRTNDSIILNRTQIASKVFNFGETSYILDPDRFQLTYGRTRLGEKEVYSTYYYKAGAPKPLPVPNFPEYENVGVSSEELRAIFTPWFYRQIAPIEETFMEKIQKFLPFVSIALLVYTVYVLSNVTNTLSEISSRLPPLPGT